MGLGVDFGFTRHPMLPCTGCKTKPTGALCRFPFNDTSGVQHTTCKIADEADAAGHPGAVIEGNAWCDTVAQRPATCHETCEIGVSTNRKCQLKYPCGTRMSIEGAPNGKSRGVMLHAQILDTRNSLTIAAVPLLLHGAHMCAGCVPPDGTARIHNNGSTPMAVYLLSWKSVSGQPTAAKGFTQLPPTTSVVVRSPTGSTKRLFVLQLVRSQQLTELHLWF